MYPVSATFLDALTKSGRRKSVVDIYYNGTIIQEDVPITDGSLSFDRNSDCRLSGDLTIALGDFDLSTIEPWGTELVVRSGVVYGNGSEELVPMGVLRIQNDNFSESARTTPPISGLDRARALLDTQTGYDIDLSGRTSQGIIGFLVNQSIPIATVFFGSGVGDLVLPGGSIFQNTYWDIAKEVATGIGAEIFFYRDGNCYTQVAPAVTSLTTAADAVWTIGVGENGVMIDADRGSSRENTYNAVAMFGAQTDDQVQPVAFVYDDNPLSKTFYFGPFGKKILRMTNNTLTTNNQCYDAARQKLKEVTALSRGVSFRCISNPALDVGDVVLFEFFDSQELHLIDQLRIPLVGGEMTGSTKSVQYIE